MQKKKSWLLRQTAVLFAYHMLAELVGDTPRQFQPFQVRFFEVLCNGRFVGNNTHVGEWRQPTCTL